tara:strand:+ start:837 stop:1163 length:327 start_codon:yes stop_codon:yes gene_type:complete
MNEEIKEYIDNAVSALVPQLTAAMQPTQQVQPVQEDAPKVVFANPYVEKLIETKSKIMEKIAAKGKCDLVYVRGSKTTTEVNQDREALNLINDELAEWGGKNAHRRIK